MTFFEIVVQILKDAGEPLNYKDITRRLLERGWSTNASDPESGVSKNLSREIKEKGERSRVVRVGPGLYYLNDGSYAFIDYLTSAEPAPVPSSVENVSEDVVSLPAAESDALPFPWDRILDPEGVSDPEFEAGIADFCQTVLRYDLRVPGTAVDDPDFLDLCQDIRVRCLDATDHLEGIENPESFADLLDRVRVLIIDAWLRMKHEAAYEMLLTILGDEEVWQAAKLVLACIALEREDAPDIERDGKLLERAIVRAGKNYMAWSKANADAVNSENLGIKLEDFHMAFLRVTSIARNENPSALIAEILDNHFRSTGMSRGRWADWALSVFPEVAVAA